MTTVPPATVLEMESDDSDTCGHVIETGENAGEVCGRDRPCRFHE